MIGGQIGGGSFTDGLHVGSSATAVITDASNKMTNENANVNFFTA